MASFTGWGTAWGSSWGSTDTDPNAMAGSASISVTATGTLTTALDDVVHAKQPKVRRRRLKWREYENLPEEVQVDEIKRPEYTGPSVLADTTDQALAFESKRLTGLLAAAKIEQENAKQRAKAAEHAKHVEAARVAVAEMIAAAQEAERLVQEIEEIDVAYIVATLLND